jgi:5-methyltetrahydrofolate--homocysteine methyltransferase
MPTLTAPSGDLAFGPGLPTVLVNDQLRIMDQDPSVLADLRDGRLDRFVELARRGHENGVDMVDLLISHLGPAEARLLPNLAVRIQEDVGCPLSLDARNPQALEAALSAIRPYKAMISAVTARESMLETILPIARKYQAVIVGMPLGHQHDLPRTVESRLAESSAILRAAERHGIPSEDVVIDAICLASAAEPGSMQVTLATLRALHEELGVATMLGIGNGGFGMPDQTHIDLAYLLAAVPWGLDVALVDPATPGLIEGVRAIDFLTGLDPYGRRYIRGYRAKQARMKAGAHD